MSMREQHNTWKMCFRPQTENNKLVKGVQSQERLDFGSQTFL